MTQAHWLQLGIAFVLMIFAGLTAAAEAALSSFSKARANRLLEEGRPGARRVRKIIDAHDGRIDVTTAPDQGTTFTVTLPVCAEEWFQ